MNGFGIPEGLIVADGVRGGFELIPTAYTVSHCVTDFTRVTIEGIMGNPFIAEQSKQEQLARFSLLDLMDEVGRRIKTGENKKESMVKKPRCIMT